MNREIECVELTPELLLVGGELLAAYMTGWQDQTPEKCAEALARLLAFPSATFVVARHKNVYCGFASLQWGFTTTKGMPILRVQSLFVQPIYRRKGVARALLNYAVELGRSAGAHRLQLETDADNDAGHQLYESFGFEQIPGKDIFMFFL